MVNDGKNVVNNVVASEEAVIHLTFIKKERGN